MTRPQFRIIKCSKCGSEYKMPNIGEYKQITMESCPTCKKLEETMKEYQRFLK